MLLLVLRWLVDSLSRPPLTPALSRQACRRLATHKAAFLEVTDAESAFNGGFWNAGNFGDQWIQVDLLTSHLVSSVSFATNQEPNGVTSHSVFISDSPIGDDFGLLAPVASRNGFSVTGTQFTFAFSPSSGRYLEIVALC